MESKKNNNKGLIWLIVILIILVVGLMSFIIYKEFFVNNNASNNIDSNKMTTTINNTTTTQNSTNENNDKNQEIDNNKIEDVIKRALLEKVAKDEYLGIWGYDNSIYAEGHKTLRTEFKDNKIYAYVLAQIGTYTKENGNYDNTSGMAGPFVLIFSNTYEFVSYDSLEDGEGYTDSLKIIFPSDLIDEATNVDYRTDFYQNQIKSYLD